jgi:N-acetylmuramoyl-L-alanine amidase
VTQGDLAAKISVAIALAADIPDRGAKYRDGLYFLNNTEEPAILIETCFVDSSYDASQYHQFFEKICQAIATAISEPT